MHPPKRESTKTSVRKKRIRAALNDSHHDKVSMGQWFHMRRPCPKNARRNAPSIAFRGRRPALRDAIGSIDGSRADDKPPSI